MKGSPNGQAAVLPRFVMDNGASVLREAALVGRLFRSDTCYFS